MNNLCGKEILQLRGNSIPRGLVLTYEDDEDVKIWTKEQPKIIKIERTLSPEAKKRYISLMKEYSDVFSWSYKDIKGYDMRIIQHTIPIKKDEMSFKQKLRRMKPKLLPLVEKEIKKLFEPKIIVALRISH